MIESLLHSKSRFLALFAVCTFSIGFYLGMMVKLFTRKTAPGLSSNGQAVTEWGRDYLEKNAAAAAWNVASVCVLLCLLSFFVLALAFISEAGGYDRGLVRFSARALYVLSFIGVISAISAAVFFIMCHL